MIIQLLCACLLAFLVSRVFGKQLISWLQRKEIVQPLKDEVEKQVYSGKEP